MPCPWCPREPCAVPRWRARGAALRPQAAHGSKPGSTSGRSQQGLWSTAAVGITPSDLHHAQGRDPRPVLPASCPEHRAVPLLSRHPASPKTQPTVQPPDLTPIAQGQLVLPVPACRRATCLLRICHFGRSPANIPGLLQEATACMPVVSITASREGGAHGGAVWGRGCVS